MGRGGNDEDAIPEITVEELKAKLDKKEDFLFLDVREKFEYEIASISGAKLIPLAQLPGRLSEIEALKDKEVVAHCHHGGRSRRALEFLKSKGFKNLKNVSGGIDHWSVKIDMSVARY